MLLHCGLYPFEMHMTKTKTCETSVRCIRLDIKGLTLRFWPACPQNGLAFANMKFYWHETLKCTKKPSFSTFTGASRPQIVLAQIKCYWPQASRQSIMSSPVVCKHWLACDIGLIMYQLQLHVQVITQPIVGSELSLVNHNTGKWELASM